MTDINGEMKAAADYAIRSAKDKFGQELDFSDQSTDKLENLLDQAYRSFSNQPKDENTNTAITRTANIWGSYLGEFMRLKWGGTWTLKGSERLVSIKNAEFSPIRFVYKKITSHPEYSVEKYLMVTKSKILPSPVIPKQSQNLSENIKQSKEQSIINQPPKNTKKNKNLVFILLGIGGFVLVIIACITFFAVVLSPSSLQNVSIMEPTEAFAEIPLLQPSLPLTVIIPSDTPSVTPILPDAEPILPRTPTQQINPTTLAPLRIHFIDVGQGDAILIQGSGGEVGLVDGGDTSSGIVQYLQSLGITHLDMIVATHPNADHIGGLVKVLNTIPVDKVVTNGMMHTTLEYEHFLDAIITSKAEYVEVKRGETILLGNLNFDVLSPISNTDDDLNNGSLVLRLVYRKVSFLFTGDTQPAAEEILLASGLDISATILKVAHHGSRSASPLDFLTAVQPEVAIYSAGLGNDYGHPHPETLDALTSVGAIIYGTDVNGTIIVTTDGDGYSIETTKQVQTPTPPIVLPTTEQTSELFINVVSLTSPITPGGTSRLTINTIPGAVCTITVYYKSGASQAAGLGSQTSGENGDVTWSWKVGSRTTPGIWRIVVTTELNGQTISTEIPFEVR